MDNLPEAPKESIVYEDEKLYVALALYPIARGHTVVMWKDSVKDLHQLGRADYEYLMRLVEITRDALLSVLNVEKVYLVYMDELKHVHWHLVPRYNEKGFNVFVHEAKKANDFALASALREKILLLTKEIG